MTSRTQITIDSNVHRKARRRAAELGVSFAEYIRRLLEQDLREPESTAEPTAVFNLGHYQGSDIARDKDRAPRATIAEQRGRATRG